MVRYWNMSYGAQMKVFCFVWYVASEYRWKAQIFTKYCFIRSPWQQRGLTTTAGTLSQDAMRMMRTVLMEMKPPETAEADIGTGWRPRAQGQVSHPNRRPDMITFNDALNNKQRRQAFVQLPWLMATIRHTHMTNKTTDLTNRGLNEI